MNLLIYLIIIVLFLVLIFWTWNNTKDFDETFSRVKFIGIGIGLLTIITLIIFNISKTGVNYPNKEVLNEIRKISLLLFVPINGFLSLPHIATIKSDFDEEKNKKRIIILGAVIIIGLIIEITYLKQFQSGIIEILKLKK